jgi:anaerobic ribonucleoside-triphosphate reductase
MRALIFEGRIKPSAHNSETVEAIVRYMADNNVGYGGINYPLDSCADCGYTGIISNECPGCSSTNIRRIRRITGYLSTTDRFNNAKLSELSRRVPLS